MKNPSLFLLSTILLAAVSTASANAQSHIERVATALNHFSVIELPEGTVVDNVAVGCQPSDVQVQWNGRDVLVKPLKPGINTNMAIFTNVGKIYNYEILPAGDPAEMSQVIHEYDAAAIAAAKQQQDVNEVHLAEADTINTQFLMGAKSIDSKPVRRPKKGINIKVTLVGQETDRLYVRFHVSNDGNHTYRIQAPKAQKIDPVFGFGEAYKNINRQIDVKEFRKFRSFQSTDIEVRFASISKQDMTPDTATDFVVAIQKPPVTPAVYRFIFPSDDGVEVSAVAIF
jgi:Conjugal transfer protein